MQQLGRPPIVRYGFEADVDARTSEILSTAERQDTGGLSAAERFVAIRPLTTKTTGGPITSRGDVHGGYLDRHAQRVTGALRPITNREAIRICASVVRALDADLGPSAAGDVSRRCQSR